MTRPGYERLMEELKRLKQEERPAVIRAIEEARGYGDLSENAEYHAAKERQSFIETRVAELEDRTRRAEVIDVARRTTDGYLRGVVRFDGMEEFRNSALVINFQNEWILALRDEQPVAMSPDLICVLDSDSGEAVGSETIRYGQRVTVIALPAPEIYLSPRGLQHVGPRAFGYDFDFKSVFA